MHFARAILEDLEQVEQRRRSTREGGTEGGRDGGREGGGGGSLWRGGI